MRQLFSTFKKTIPSGSKKEVDVIETWSVHWLNCRYDDEPQAQFFTNPEDAATFKVALEDAAKLLKTFFRSDPHIQRHKS